MSKTVLIAIADGVEEIETIAIIDVLRRAEADVTIASIYQNRLTVSGAHNITLTADVALESCAQNNYDLIVIPGGLPGADNLNQSALLIELFQRQKSNNKLYGAICASPAILLASNGLLDDKDATCYPGFEEALPNQSQIKSRVVVDGNCITSQGPGTALEFGIELVKQLYGENKADTIQQQMLITSE